MNVEALIEGYAIGLIPLILYKRIIITMDRRRWIFSLFKVLVKSTI